MIQSLDRGIKILELLEEKKSAAVTEVAAFLKINKSSAFRLLDTLRANNTVEKDTVTDRYRLSAGVIRFAKAYLNTSMYNIPIHHYLEELVHLTKESAHYCVFSNNRVVVIDQIRSVHSVSVTAMIGHEEKIYCTSVGKAILAYLPPKIQQSIIDSIEFEPVAPNTITSKEVLIKNLEQVVETGYAVDDEENMKGVRCVAAPIRDFRGNVNNCIGISGPIIRMETNVLQKYTEIVKSVADKISLKLGFKIEERVQEAI